MWTFEIIATARGRVKTYVTDWRAQTVCGNIKIFERPPDEDSGCVDGIVESSFAIDQQDSVAPPGE